MAARSASGIYVQTGLVSSHVAFWEYICRRIFPYLDIYVTLFPKLGNSGKKLSDMNEPFMFGRSDLGIFL